MSLRNLFSSLAPMAAGALAGPMGFGYALAAGAATGAGSALISSYNSILCPSRCRAGTKFMLYARTGAVQVLYRIYKLMQ